VRPRAIVAGRVVLAAFCGFACILTLMLTVGEGGARHYDSSPAEWRAAVTSNPRLSSAWIQLGLYAEREGHLPEAEADLLQAARVDRQYVPAWTLANFYFRRGDPASFWPWAQRAAALTFDDYRPLLRLADRLAASPTEAAARMGGGAPLLRAYLDLLIGAARLDSAQEIALALREYHDPSDAARLADFADRAARASEIPKP
jgi:tetratricopeptide (TPR) repeat protein